MDKRPHWYDDHPPACTCWDCNEGRGRRRQTASRPHASRSHTAKERKCPMKGVILVSFIAVAGLAFWIGSSYWPTGKGAPEVTVTLPKVEVDVPTLQPTPSPSPRIVVVTATPLPTVSTGPVATLLPGTPTSKPKLQPLPLPTPVPVMERIPKKPGLPVVPIPPTATPSPTPTLVPAETPVHLLSPIEIMRLVDRGKLTEEQAVAILAERKTVRIPTPDSNAAPAPTPTPTPMPTPTPVERFNRDYLETNILRIINDFRIANGRSALRVDDRLAEIALAHSQDMAQNNHYSHINLRGEDPTARARRVGYDCYNPRSIGIAENIHVLYGHTSSLGLSYEWETQETMARRFAADFMASPGHRRNILDPRYGLTGLGVALGSYNGIEHAIFVTHNFC